MAKKQPKKAMDIFISELAGVFLGLDLIIGVWLIPLGYFVNNGLLSAIGMIMCATSLLAFKGLKPRAIR